MDAYQYEPVTFLSPLTFDLSAMGLGAMVLAGTTEVDAVMGLDTPCARDFQRILGCTSESRSGVVHATLDPWALEGSGRREPLFAATAEDLILMAFRSATDMETCDTMIADLDQAMREQRIVARTLPQTTK